MVHGERQTEYREGFHTATESAGRHQENEKTRNKIDNHAQPFFYTQES